MTGGGMLTGIFSVALALTTANAEVPQQQQQPPQEQAAPPRFRSSVDMVSVAAVVGTGRAVSSRTFPKKISKSWRAVSAGTSWISVPS